MTKHIVLALALTLGTAAIATPSVRACGGYDIESPEAQAVRAAVLAVAPRRYGPDASIWVDGIATEGAIARATVYVSRTNQEAETHEVTLRHRDGAWRVLAFS